ncbi:hypothetical protein HGRIS_009281 [Hohenbuehelia grisea]|uniref:Ras-GAP domain-containing protein n=1 Tax=Hohenbuehelia grisea TaxID=104357 RepID=A0ABR3J0S9_9AGAR
MPLRRPSASASLHANGSTAGASRAHKTSDSHHGLAHSSSQPHSLMSLSASATPQQKVVQVLVTRLKNKLPCYSGVQLDQLEADNAIEQAVEALVDLANDSLDMIAYALSELLDRLAKVRKDHTAVPETSVTPSQHHDGSGFLTIEVLQSQLFILKVLCLAMSTRWNQNVRSSSRASNRPTGVAPDSPIPPGTPRRNRQAELNTPPPWNEPPPLDETCAKYILSVMVVFLRQTATEDIPLMYSSRYCDTSFRDFESLDLLTATPVLEANQNGPPLPSDFSPLPDPILRSRPSKNSVRSGKASINSAIPNPSNAIAYEKTHMTVVRSSSAVNALIAKFVGRIVYHLSASNWHVVYYRIRNKIHFLASNTEENPDVIDLQLLAYCAMDRIRLLSVLTELCSLLVNMKKESHVSIAIPLRVALWNWADLFPAEFNDVVRTKSRLEGAPERVFDLLYNAVVIGNERQLWPTLTVLNCFSFDRISSDHHMSRFQFGQFVQARGSHRKSALWLSHVRKPFWDTEQDIDLGLYAECLVILFRFCAEDEAIEAFKACMEPERSDAVKTVAIRALLTLVLEARRMPWQKGLENLQTVLAPRCRGIFKAAALRRPETDQSGYHRRTAARPQAKSSALHPLTDKENLILATLSLWRACPAFYFEGAEESELGDWAVAAIKIWDSTFDVAVKISTACTLKFNAEMLFKMAPTDPYCDQLVTMMKRSLSYALTSIVTNLFDCRADLEAQKLWMMISHQILELFLRKSDAPHIKEIQLTPNRLPAFALAEIVFLISLASADMTISQMAARGLRQLTQAESQPDAPVSPIWTDEARANRDSVYEQLGDPTVIVIGRVGHQKRIRKLLRQIRHTTATHVAVWDECRARWTELSDHVKEPAYGPAEASQHSAYGAVSTVQEKFFLWQNLTLFLAALGVACLRDDPNMQPLSAVVPLHQLPDRIRIPPNHTSAVGQFMTELTAMLMVENAQVRDVAREALGAEISPRLYPKLIKYIDNVISQLKNVDGAENNVDNYELFLDQFISVVKLIVDNVQIQGDDIVNIDISSTMLAFASIISRITSAPLSRIKAKFCQLCDTVCDRKDVLTLRRDGSARHNILDIIMDWIASTSNDYDDDGAQNELNLCCLRTSVKLLDKLQLRPLDSAAVDDHAHVVSRLFNRYATALLRGLDLQSSASSDNASEMMSLYQSKRYPQNASQRDAEYRELVITGLTHLVSSNTESGFKQCLPLAFDSDLRKRTIFARVFARVLENKVRFEPEDRSAKLVRQNRLCELLKGSDMMIPLAICEICPPGEADNIINVLLNLFDTRASLMTLLKKMIDREIASTENDAGLFRGNTTFTRFMSQFAKIHGYNYLRSLVHPLIKSMAGMPPGHSYDLDPNRVTRPEELEQNKKNVEFIAAMFLEIVTSSIPTLPSMFREVCSHIAQAVSNVWPDSKFPALGAFMFLRFISPAIVSPATIDLEAPQDGTMRRGLMIVAKIIQNLANNIFFGKEAHMVILNKFLEENIVIVTRYLSELNKFSAANTEEEADEWLGTSSDDTDIIVLHRFLSKHADQIGAELLSQANSPGDSASTKDAWNSLCALMVDLGKPLEPPTLSPATTSDHQEYLDLMTRFSNKNVGPVQDIFVELPLSSRLPKTVFFALFVSKIDVQALDIELLMYHIFMTLTSPEHDERSFEFIVDCTYFTSGSEIPLQWVKYAVELIPSDIRSRIQITHILNPNAQTQRYLRRLCNVCAGVWIGGDISFYTSLTAMTESISESVLEPLAAAAALERERSVIFHGVSMRQVHQMRVPVDLEVRSTHLRITTVKAQPLAPNRNCKAVEILPITDISDVYSISTGQEQQEFIIRRTRQGVTVYFASPERDVIVKAIRTAKGQLRDVHSIGTERTTKFSNVSATLLHIGLLCLDQNNDELHAAAYELLGAIGTYMNFEKSPVIASKAGFAPGDPSTFAVQLSEKFADFAPELTLDFLSEISSTIAVMDRNAVAQRIFCLQYMSPWMKNLAHFPNATHTLYERSGARLRDCMRVLADLTVTDHEISHSIIKHVWSEIGKLDTNAVNIILDELIRSAADGGINTRRCDTTARIISSFSSINVRARLYMKLRKALSKITPRMSKSLVANPNWNEIATLIMLILMVSSSLKNPAHSQIFVPEVLHLVTLVAGTGPPTVRKAVYGIVMNLLQAIYTSKAEDDPAATEVSNLLATFQTPETLALFGLQRLTKTCDYTSLDPVGDSAQIDNYEGLTDLLLRLIEISANSKGLLNVWRARWMSLVTSTAFQHLPAIQMRAFTALGCLATSDVDDDFLYQMLVALKAALIQASEDDTVTVVCMLRAIRKVVPGLPDQSRYIFQLFWLAVALLQGSHIHFYVEATELLRVTLETMEQRGAFRYTPIADVLLENRASLEDVACQLDGIQGLSFETSFTLSLSAIIVRGVRHSNLKDSAEAVLRSLLKITIRTAPQANGYNGDVVEPLHPEALGYFLALLPLSTTPATYRKLLEDCNADQAWLLDPGVEGTPGSEVPRVSLDFLGIHDMTTALLVTSFAGAIVTTAQGDDAETELLFNLLSDIASVFPETMSIVYESLQDKIKDAFANSSNPTIIRAVSNIFRMAAVEIPRFPILRGSSSTLSNIEEGRPNEVGSVHMDALEALNMNGLPLAFSFLPQRAAGMENITLLQWISEIIGLTIT